ncbi:MAG: bacillithiol biosynthesis deacetylase BshB1 [Ginsengibacter sp.]
MKLHILAFGVHPDDVELSCAGTLLTEKKNGKKIGIVDLTKGELGTRGNAATREKEAADAALIMNADIRDNLSMADGFFVNDKENQLKIITCLRKYKPEIVLCNAPEDRHPDHGRSSQLVSDAAFLSGLKKIITHSAGKDENGSTLQAEWRPKYVFHYIQDRFIQPDFVIDITDVFEKKLEAIKAFKTQFFNSEAITDEEPKTYISSPEFLDSVIYRSKMFGKMIGVKYAEGYISSKMIGIRSFDDLIKENT